MSRVTANVFANFAGSFWGAVMSLLFVPVYIRYLGMEAYGLIGISAAIAMTLSLSDFGMAAALTREMAREWKGEEDICEGRRALSTLARLYIPLALLLGGLVIVAAPYLASNWVNVSTLQNDVVTRALQLIGVTAVFQLISAFYSAGLLGLQRQVLANVIGAVGVTIQTAGSVLVLVYYGADIVAFFVWQAIVAGFQATVIAVTMNELVPGSRDCRGFDRALLRKMIGFALGMSGISLLSIVLSQTDKIVLSKLLSLHDFGLYSLGVVVAMSLKRLFGPLFSAVYPRFTEVVRRNEVSSMEVLYHLTSQAMSAIVLPASLLLAFCSREVVYVWTGDAAIAEQIHLLVALMVTGTALNGLIAIPYAMQLAHGRTRLALMMNLFAAPFFVAATYLLGKSYGGEGAAIAWLALNLAYILIYVPLVHKQILPQGMRRWYMRDTLLPGLAAAGPLLVALPLLRIMEGERVVLIVVIAVAYVISVSMAVLAASELRGEIWRRINARAYPV